MQLKRFIVAIAVRQDDLTSAEVQMLGAEHLSGMHGNSPAGHVQALAIDDLRAASITFWTAWDGEIKSMRTRSAFLRRGVGQALLDEIIRTAKRRGYARLHLETGTGDAFEPAHALYRRNKFERGAPFGDYVATDFNVFMVKSLG